MQLIKMKYKNCEFSINPKEIKVVHSKNIISHSILDNFVKTQFMSVKPISIIGSGILVGNDKYKNLFDIENVFNDKSSDYLFVPGFPPVKAYFKELSYTIDAQKNCIRYDFEFIEDNNGKKDKYDYGYVIARANENLYDVANRINVDVEKLVEHNDFEDLFSIKEGDKVYYA